MNNMIEGDFIYLPSDPYYFLDEKFQFKENNHSNVSSESKCNYPKNKKFSAT